MTTEQKQEQSTPNFFSLMELTQAAQGRPELSDVLRYMLRYGYRTAYRALLTSSEREAFERWERGH